MRIYVVRHSVPENPDDAPFSGGDDADDPPLTQEGREIVKNLADWMKDKGEIPSVLIASPMQRTQETAEILRDRLDIMPRVVTDLSVGPHMSIRGLVKRVLADESMTRVGIVSHHESIEHGMRVLDMNPFVHLDQLAQGELRILKVDRETAEWDEHRRVLPSDLGGADHY